MTELAELETLLEATQATLGALEYHHKQRITARTERRAARDLSKAFRAQGAYFLHHFAQRRYLFPAEVTEALRPADWESLLSAALSNFRRTFLSILGRTTREAMALGAARLVATLGMDASLSLSSPRAAARMAAVGAERVTGIEDTTRAAMRDLLTRATEQGWSYSRTASAIRDRFDGFSRGRAELIATNETADAYEVGRASLIDELMGQGLGFEKSWITAGDDRVDEECDTNESDGWIPAEDQFSSGDTEAPAHPGCRCATTYQLADPSSGTQAADDLLDQVAAQLGVDAEELAGEVDGLAGGVFNEASGFVEDINAALAQIVDGQGGAMFGEEYRLKSLESIASKIMRDAYEMPGTSLEEIAAGVKDAIRFTATFSDATYAADVRATVQSLLDQGFKVTSKWRNDWTSWDHHGILARFIAPNGYEFELQFHTEASAAGKEAVHGWYEQWRVLTDKSSAEALHLQELMAEYTKAHVPIPSGATTLSGFLE